MSGHSRKRANLFLLPRSLIMSNLQAPMNLLRPGSAALSFVLVSTSLSSLAQVSHKQPHFNEVGRATIHPPELPQPLQLIFESADTGRGFTRIVFRSTDGSYTISSAYVLRRLNTPGDPRADTPDFNVPNLRFDSSRYFRIGHYTDSLGEHTLLFFMGEGIASDACAMLLMGFDTNGKPYKLLEKETFEVTSFSQSTDGKPALIVGKPTLSQVMGNIDNPTSRPYATTYDPFAVYVLTAAPQKAVYSLEESRRYNQQHYVWSGPHSSETTFVYYNIPNHRKPFAAPASDVGKFVK
jgi:hypothetical protein